MVKGLGGLFCPALCAWLDGGNAAWAFLFGRRAGDGMEEPKLKPQLKLLAINYLGKCKGNKVQSAIAAGYKPTYAKAQSYKLFARPDVQAYIAYLQSKEGDVARGVMELEDIQRWWSDVMRNPSARFADRIRASELLAKSKGAFKDEWS